MREDETGASTTPSLADPAKLARKHFYDTFNRYCLLRLLPDAERRLAEIFQQTIVFPIYTGTVDWDNDARLRAIALDGVREIARRTQRKATVVVTEADLTAAADEVVCERRDECNARMEATGRKEPFYVFCQAYEVDCAQVRTSSSGSTTTQAGDPAMVARARDDFLKHAHRWVYPNSFSEDAQQYLLDPLFARTIQYAIEQGKVDWDKERQRRKYALRRVAEIMELASFRSETGVVDAELLHGAANDVIGLWQPMCEQRAARYVFCKAWRHEEPGGIESHESR
jgi:hypothetical protein